MYIHNIYRYIYMICGGQILEDQSQIAYFFNEVSKSNMLTKAADCGYKTVHIYSFALL